MGIPRNKASKNTKSRNRNAAARERGAAKRAAEAAEARADAAKREREKKMSAAQVKEHNRRVKEVEAMDDAAKTFVTTSHYTTSTGSARNHASAQAAIKQLK